MELVDQFLRKINYLRISVTDRCDLRCVYCMKEKMNFLPKNEILTLEEIDRLCFNFIQLGVEKIAFSSVAIENPKIISEIANIVGNQSVVVVLDVKKKRFTNKYELLTHNGTKNTTLNPVDMAKKVEAQGCGEIVINSITNDGMMVGYDYKIIDVRNLFEYNNGRIKIH